MAKTNVLEAVSPVSEVYPVDRKPALVIGFGRGFGGKSTLLSEIAWRAQNQGRSAIVADFDARAPYYRRAVVHWVTSAKREATRERRLAQLIESSRAGEEVPPLRRR